jgi:hypothetical protein
MVIGRIDQLVDESAARGRIAALHLDINFWDARLKGKPDVNFRAREISVTRSIVFQVVGPCKTEASKKPIPLDSYLAKALRAWRKHTKYRRPDDWIFASPLAAVDGRTGRSPSCVT